MDQLSSKNTGPTGCFIAFYSFLEKQEQAIDYNSCLVLSLASSIVLVVMSSVGRLGHLLIQDGLAADFCQPIGGERKRRGENYENSKNYLNLKTILSALEVR